MDKENLEELEQLEKDLELNIEDEQSEGTDENIENAEVDEEDEFADVEFISQDEVRKRKLKLIKGQIFRTFVMFIALVAFAYASYELTLIYLENDTSFATKDEISSMFLHDVEELPEGNVIYNSNGETIIMENASDGKAFVWDYQKMLEYNSESVGYIRQGSGEYIDYPVLQHSDNDYYLYHLPDHKWSSMGSIFLDYRIEGGLNADYSIIYGHYIGKRANNIMFGSLNWYWNRYYYHIDNPDFDIYVEDRHYKYYVFSIMKVPASGDRVYNPYFESDEERFEFFKEVEAQSKYEFTKAPELTMDSKVIMLSTCTTDEEVRFVMFLVRGEEIYDVPGVDYENDSSQTEESGKDTTTTSKVDTTTPSATKDESTTSKSETTTSKSNTTSGQNTTTSKQDTTTSVQTATTSKQDATTSKQDTTTSGQEDVKDETTTTGNTVESDSSQGTDNSESDTGTEESPEQSTEADSSSEEEVQSSSDEQSTGEQNLSEQNTTPME